jgi:excisionase family DNA binding protein
MAGKSNILREYLSVKELSEYTGICVRTLRDMLNASANPIPAYRFGGSIKIKRSEFDEWAKSCRIDNDRVNQMVDEVLVDLGIKPIAKNLPTQRTRKEARRTPKTRIRTKYSSSVQK